MENLIVRLVSDPSQFKAAMKVAEASMRSWESTVQSGLMNTTEQQTKAIEAVKAHQRAIENKTDSGQSAFARFGNAATSAFSAVGQSAAGAAKALALVSAPIALMGTKSAVAAASFERTGAMIEGLAGASREQVAAMSKEVLAMAPVVGRMPQELAEAMYFLSSSGIKGERAIEAVRVSGMAASAGLGDTATVARVVGAAMNAYAKTGLTAAQVTDTLSAAVREGSAEASSMVGPIGRLIPLSSAVGVSFSEILGPLAAITRTGASAAEAGVSLQGILSTLLKPSRQARTQLASVGLSMERLREVVRGPNGVINVIRILERAFKGNEEAMSQVFGNIRPLRGVLALLAQDGGEVATVLHNVNNSSGSLATAFEAVARTASFKFDQAMAHAKVGMIVFGAAILEVLGPALAALSQTLMAAVGWWSALDESTRQTIVTWLTVITAAGALAAVILGVVKVLALLKIWQLITSVLWLVWSFDLLRVKILLIAFKIVVYTVATALAILQAILGGSLFLGFLATAVLLVPVVILATAAIYAALVAVKAFFSGLGQMGSVLTSSSALGEIFSGWGAILKEIWATMQVDGPLAWKMLSAAAGLALEQIKVLLPPLWAFIKTGFGLVADFVKDRFILAFDMAMFKMTAKARKSPLGKILGFSGEDQEAGLASYEFAATTMAQKLEAQLREAGKAFDQGVESGDMSGVAVARATLDELRDEAASVRFFAELDEAFPELLNQVALAAGPVGAVTNQFQKQEEQLKKTKKAAKDLKLEFTDAFGSEAAARVEAFREAVSPSIRSQAQGTTYEDILKKIEENTRRTAEEPTVDVEPGEFDF